jgi:serpin B
MEQLEDGFGAGLNLVDFTGDPAEARDEINEWVADKTEDRIEDIVPPDAVTEATRLVLANAIWFSGPWQATFDPESTEDGDFTLLDGNPVTVPFMFQHESLPYAEGDGFQAIELPYDGSGFAFTILLPDEGEPGSSRRDRSTPTPCRKASMISRSPKLSCTCRASRSSSPPASSIR